MSLRGTNPENEGIDALRRSIVDDTRESAELEIEQARLAAAREMDRRLRQAGQERERILREAECAADTVRRRTISRGELESKQQLLGAREELIRQVLDRALAEAAGEHRTSRRRTLLLRLVVEAARETGCGRILVSASRDDLSLLSPDLLSEAADQLSREGISAQLEAAKDPADIVGGVVVAGDGGRVVVDNSLEARLRRQEGAMRSAVWRILSQADPVID